MSYNENDQMSEGITKEAQVDGGGIERNSNDEIYQRFTNEAKRTVNYHAIKRGSTIILVIGIVSFIFAGLTAYLLYDDLTPLGWFLLIIDSVVLLICGIFARKGHIWAFIAAIVIYGLGTINPLIRLDWMTLVFRIGILVMLVNALKNVRIQKRVASEESMQHYRPNH